MNDKWYSVFPSSVAFVGSPGFSDHDVLSITLEPNRMRTKKPFRFYNFLIQNPEFLATICISWFSYNITGSAMFRVSKKLKLLKNVIREFSRQSYSGIEIKTALAHEKLLQAQSAMLSLPSPSNAATELQAQHEWEELSSAETAFFYQRTSINWLSLGDGNSSLFHRYAASRQALNHIHFLTAPTGEQITSQAGIQELCVDYFGELLGSPVSDPLFIQSDMDMLFDFKCSPGQAASFEKEFSAEDVRNAFFSLPKNKSGGPDGYSAEFFTASWMVVGPEVTGILSFRKTPKAVELCQPCSHS